MKKKKVIFSLILFLPVLFINFAPAYADNETTKCVDSDNGKDFLLRGSVRASGDEYLLTDFCYDENTLVEYYCNPDERVDSIMHNCENECRKGICAEESKDDYIGLKSITGYQVLTPELTAADFTSDFEMGNGVNFVKLSPTVFQFDAESDPAPQTWTANFYVKISQHARGNAPTIKVRNRWGIYVPYVFEHAPNVRPIYSYDQANWFRVPSANYDSVSDVLTFQAPNLTQDTVWLALQIPYHYSTDYASDRARWNSNPFVSFSVLGTSIQGRNIELFTITNPSSVISEAEKKVFYITGTNHPQEWNALWRVRGIIEWALSNDTEAIRFRDTSILKATLTKNPDGWVHGYFRTNVMGKDMNRDWQGTGADAALEQPETYAVHHDIDTYAATHPIALFLDSHTGESGDMLFRPVAMPNDASIAALNSILKSLDAPNYIQDSIFDDIFPNTTFSNALYNQYKSAGSKSFFMENGGLRHNNGGFVTKESAQTVGKIFIKAFFKWLNPITAPTLTFSASPSTIASGQSSTLSWSSANTTSCVASGAWSGTKATSGTQIVTPLTTSTYTLTCIGSGGSVTKSTTATVTPTLSSGPVLAFPFNSTSGVIATDTSGTGNDGTLLNGASWITGKYGNGVNFGRVNDVINAGSQTSLDDIWASGGTVELWVNPRSISTQSRLAHKAATNTPTGGFIIALTPDNCQGGAGGTFRLLVPFTTTNGQWCAPDGSIPLNQWTHIAVTYDGSNAANNPKMYINGVSAPVYVQIRPIGNRVSDAAENWLIGNSKAGDRPLDGVIDEYRIYNHILSLSEVQTDMNTEIAPSPILAPILSFSASPLLITSGQSSTLSWSSANTNSCVASGAWSGTKATSGTQAVNPAITSTYTLTCTGSGGSDTKSATVTVTPPIDTTPPTVLITSPSTGATVSNTITISATASDNIGVAGVQFKLDGTNLGTEDTTSPYSLSWDTRTATNGAHTLTAIARDAAGNTGSNSISVTVNNADLTPPIISNVEATSITINSAAIMWDTDEASDSQVEYGTTTAYGSSTLLSTAKTTTHSVILNGLISNTLYHYRVKSKDASNNLAVSSDFTFTTLVVPDTTPPLRSDPSPTDALTSGITATTISLKTDEAANCRYSTTPLISYSAMMGIFSTTGTSLHATIVSGLSDGSLYKYYVRCIDTAGNFNSNDFIIEFSIAADTTLPTVSITSPSSGATVSNTITVSAAASDDTGVVGVQFKLDGTNLGTEDTASSYSYSFDTRTTTNGLHTLTATARDAAGNVKTSASISITVSNLGEVIDTDNDTIPDSIDKCPSTLTNKTNKYGCPLPKGTEFNDTLTTNFSDADLTNLTALKLGKTDVAMIDFGDNPINLIINSTKPVDLDSIIDLLPWKIIVRVELFKNLNVSATLSFFNITNITNPRILKNAATCEDCRIESYANNIVKFKVPHFTEYSLEEGSYCGDAYCSTQESCSGCSSDCGDCPSSGGSSGGGGSGGGGGGSGGGGSSGGGGFTGFVCNIDWHCGSWNECDGKWQTRTCNFIKVAQHTQNTPCQTLSDQPSLAQRCEKSIQEKEAIQELNEKISPPETKKGDVKDAEEIKSELERKGNGLKTVLIVLAIVILSIALISGGVYEIRNARNRDISKTPSDETRKNIYNYIIRMRGNGKDDTEIKSELVRAGWNQDIIDSIMKEK